MLDGGLPVALEEQGVLQGGQVGALAVGFAAVGVDALAAVAGVEMVAVGKAQLGDGALVLAAAAVDIAPLQVAEGIQRPPAR